MLFVSAIENLCIIIVIIYKCSWPTHLRTKRSQRQMISTTWKTPFKKQIGRSSRTPLFFPSFQLVKKKEKRSSVFHNRISMLVIPMEELAKASILLVLIKAFNTEGKMSTTTH